MTADPRCVPFLELEEEEVRALVAPAIDGAQVERISRVGGGLVNTIYRVIPSEGPPVGLRIYPGGVDAFEKECSILTRAPASLLAPRVLFAAAGSLASPHPYIVYRWVDGVTLNECRRSAPGASLVALAAPLGSLAASVAGGGLQFDLPTTTASASLARAEEQLRRRAARDRLGDAVADALRTRLAAVTPRLEEADRTPGLVHGDFGGRNIVVAPAEDGAWRVSGLLDWERAFVGAALWDVGSLFRYAHRYSAPFREGFEAGYRGAGGALPDDWYLDARLLDATRLVDILSGDPDLPVVYAECRSLVETVLSECTA